MAFRCGSSFYSQHTYYSPLLSAKMSSAVATQTRSNTQKSRRINRGRGGGGNQGTARNIKQKAEDSTSQAEISQTATPTKDANTTEKQADVDESSVCWICAEPVKYYSVSECNHRTCHVCALRLRALYKKSECTFCKVSFLFRISVIHNALSKNFTFNVYLLGAKACDKYDNPYETLTLSSHRSRNLL